SSSVRPTLGFASVAPITATDLGAKKCRSIGAPTALMPLGCDLLGGRRRSDRDRVAGLQEKLILADHVAKDRVTQHAIARRREVHVIALRHAGVDPIAH